MAIQQRRASDVRINEIDLSTSIVNNSNATAALAVISAMGPISPTYYSNFDDFRFDHGDPNARVSFDHYSAKDFFAEGNSLWSVRVPGVGYKYSAAVVKENSANNATTIVGLPSGVKDPAEPDWGAYVAGTQDTPLYLITPKRGPGSYADRTAVSIISENLDRVTGLTIALDQTEGLTTADTYQYQVAAVGKAGEALASAMVTITVAAGNINKSLMLSWNPVAGAMGYYIYGRKPGSGNFGRVATVGANATSYLDICAAPLDASLQPITDPTKVVNSGIFTLNVFDLNMSSTRPVEAFTCSVQDQTDETGAQMEVTQRVNPFSRYIRVESNVYSLLVPPVIKTVATPVALAGGNSGATPTAADINNYVDQFLNKELYTVDVFINSGRGSVSVQQHLEYVSRTRNDAVAFLDVPSSMQSAQSAVDFRNLQLNLNSSYAALFCSDLLETDPISGKILYVPPSGAMAGLYARTSRIAQPWFSIAGLNRGLLNVLNIRNSYDDGEATRLFQNQVNYMRKFVGKGIPLWEQSTLYTKNSALQFLNVRFLCNVLKRSMYDYLLYGLQEPGDDILRRQLQSALEEYLKLVKATRGIKSFRVVISDVNNPPSLVNSGVLAVSVIITPILAVREIQLTLVISKEGIEVTEAEIASMG